MHVGGSGPHEQVARMSDATSGTNFSIAPRLSLRSRGATNYAGGARRLD